MSATPPRSGRAPDAAPTGSLPAPPVDRSAAFAQGAPGIPANFIFWVLGAVLALSVGGLVAERVFSSTGLNPTASGPAATTTTAPPLPGSLPAAVVAPPSRSLAASLGAFMGVHTTAPRPAPAFSLTDQAGRPVAVPAAGHVVVLTFFDARCDDICPVLAAEIGKADRQLGSDAARVEFVTVNTDPNALAASAEAPVLGQAGLAALPNWHMVTGPLASLDAVWKDYGVSISLDPKTGREAHNDVMDFIDGRGMLRVQALPFADESTAGAYSLPPGALARWARGIAVTAEGLSGR